MPSSTALIDRMIAYTGFKVWSQGRASKLHAIDFLVVKNFHTSKLFMSLTYYFLSDPRQSRQAA